MDPHAKLIPMRLHPLGFIEAFTQLGASLDDLLQGTGIERRLLDDKDAKISYAQQRKLIVNGIRACRQPGIGLHVGNNFAWSYHGTIGSVVYCSPSLRAAGEAFHRYVMIAQPFYAMCPPRPVMYIYDRDLLIYPLRCLPPGDDDQSVAQFELEFRLATTLRFWDMCGNKSVADPSVRVCLKCPEPPHADLYRELPCASVQFGAESSYLAAHRDFVLQPFRQFRRHAFEEVLRRCEEELRRSELEKSYTAKVRWHVYANFNKQVTLEKIAEILEMAPRTLTRRLAAENTTFRDILHDVRMELTSYHLRHSKLSVDEIAELMGFSCASSLRRAIKNWTGETASAMRAYARERSVALYAAVCVASAFAAIQLLA